MHEAKRKTKRNQTIQSKNTFITSFIADTLEGEATNAGLATRLRGTFINGGTSAHQPWR